MAVADPLSLAIDVARLKRDQQELRWLELKRKQQAAAEQWQQLKDHADQLDQQWVLSAHHAMGTELIQNYQQFSQRLQQALSLQNSVLLDWASQVQFAHQQLLVLETRVKGLGLIQDKKQAALQKLQDKREQHHLDEHSARKHRTKLNALKLGGASA